MENVIVGIREIRRKRRVGVKFTICGVSTGILTFPESVVSFKVIEKIIRRGGCLVGWVVAFWGTDSNTGADAAKDIRHELVTRWEITRKEILKFYGY